MSNPEEDDTDEALAELLRDGLVEFSTDPITGTRMVKLTAKGEREAAGLIKRLRADDLAAEIERLQQKAARNIRKWSSDA